MNDSSSVCYLLQFDVFDNIPENEIRDIAGSWHGQKFSKGETIYTPHQELDTIYILRQGEVILYHSHDGKSETFDTLHPGALFGNFRLNPTKPTHFAQATRDTMACSFTTKDFSKVFSNRPELMMRFIEVMGERLADYEKRFKNSLFPAKIRIYDELKRFKEKKKNGLFGKLFDKQVPIRLTHEEIASITGLNRVTVTRSLKELKEDGLVTVDPSSGVIELHEMNK